jgi:hypothetical protein
MTEDKPHGVPLTGPFFCGTFDQRRAIERWEDAGWTFLHWTEVPKIMAVLEGPLDDIIFIDQHGWAWQGPTYRKSAFVPLEKYPPIRCEDMMVT